MKNSNSKKIHYTTLYVGNLNYTRDEKGVSKLFSKFGKVQSVKLILRPNTDLRSGVAFVEMINKDEAMEAVKALNGRQIDGRTLKTSIAKERDWFEVVSEDEKKMAFDVTTNDKNKKIAPRTRRVEKPVYQKEPVEAAEFKPKKKRRKSGLEILFKHLGKI
ncbi:MAG: hypothetical protein JNM93_11745 [Bacteriovoracaceae bacterium]|nr:hypothetical protein [Bacteriovoracaceae bacterium]